MARQTLVEGPQSRHKQKALGGLESRRRWRSQHVKLGHCRETTTIDFQSSPISWPDKRNQLRRRHKQRRKSMMKTTARTTTTTTTSGFAHIPTVCVAFKWRIRRQTGWGCRIVGRRRGVQLELSAPPQPAPQPPTPIPTILSFPLIDFIELYLKLCPLSFWFVCLDANLDANSDANSKANSHAN